MIYEWRVYEIIPGRKSSSTSGSQKAPARLFEKRGMAAIGFWENVIGGRTNALYYMLTFRNLDHLGGLEELQIDRNGKRW